MSVAAFYCGKRVLLTGSTGFLGKVLLERLLWEGLGELPLHLLVRGDPDQRLSELATSHAFERLRQRSYAAGHSDFLEWFRSVVCCFSCDLEAPDLGMDKDQRRNALGNIGVVMHCAARVSWDERLDVAIKANTQGTRSLFQACAEEATLGSPPVFVHVSSAFVHGMAPAPHKESAMPWGSIKGRLDPISAPRFDVEALIEEAVADGVRVDKEFAAAASRGSFAAEAAARLPSDACTEEVSALARSIAGRRARAQLSEQGIKLARQHGWWDPYTFSKALAEMLLVGESKRRGVPLVVVRPSGIISCAEEPSPGWIDAYLLNEPIIEATGRGQLTAFPGREDSVLDMVPADFVVNLILVATARPPAIGSEPKVYQAVSGDVNPVCQGELARWWFDYFRECPFRDKHGQRVEPVLPKLIGSLEEFLQRTRWRAAPVNVACSVLGALPGRGALLQQWRMRLGKLRGAVENAMRLASLYSVYTIERFEFKSDKYRELLASLDEDDRQQYARATCDDIDWRAYFCDLHIPGMRKHVLREADVEPVCSRPTRALARRQPPLARL